MPPITVTEKMAAYREVKERFSLDRHQRTALDSSEHYEAIMQVAVQRDWNQAHELLIEARILCPFTHAHTRHWCGNQFCRES